MSGGMNVPFEGQIDAVAQQFNVDPALIAAIISVESNFSASAVNNTGGDAARGGSYGLMQMSLKTAQGYGYSGTGPGLLDVMTNLTYGTRYLADCVEQANGDIAGAASCYNSGSTKNAAGAYATKVVSAYNMFTTAANTETDAGDVTDTSSSTDWGQVVVLLAGAAVIGLALWYTLS
jgi:soluble lytic murein transglycosylase-like protein